MSSEDDSTTVLDRSGVATGTAAEAGQVQNRCSGGSAELGLPSSAPTATPASALLGSPTGGPAVSTAGPQSALKAAYAAGPGSVVKLKRTRQRVDAGEPRNSYASITNFSARPSHHGSHHQSPLHLQTQLGLHQLNQSGKRARIDAILSNMLPAVPQAPSPPATQSNASAVEGLTKLTSPSMPTMTEPQQPVNGCKKRKLYQPQQATAKLMNGDNDEDPVDELDDELSNGPTDDQISGASDAESEDMPSDLSTAAKRPKRSSADEESLKQQLEDLQQQMMTIRQRYLQLLDMPSANGHGQDEEQSLDLDKEESSKDGLDGSNFLDDTRRLLALDGDGKLPSKAHRQNTGDNAATGKGLAADDIAWLCEAVKSEVQSHVVPIIMQSIDATFSRYQRRAPGSVDKARDDQGQNKDLTLLMQMLESKGPRTSSKTQDQRQSTPLNGHGDRGPSPYTLATESAPAPKSSAAMPPPFGAFPGTNFKSPFGFLPGLNQPAGLQGQMPLFNSLASALGQREPREPHDSAARERHTDSVGSDHHGRRALDNHSTGSAADRDAAEPSEALSLVMTPRRKRHKVTDTRITPRTVSRLLGQDPALLDLFSRDLIGSPPNGGLRGYSPNSVPPPLVPVSLPTSVAIPNPSLHHPELFPAGAPAFPFSDPSRFSHAFPMSMPQHQSSQQSLEAATKDQKRESASPADKITGRSSVEPIDVKEQRNGDRDQTDERQTETMVTPSTRTSVRDHHRPSERTAHQNMAAAVSTALAAHHLSMLAAANRGSPDSMHAFPTNGTGGFFSRLGGSDGAGDNSDVASLNDSYVYDPSMPFTSTLTPMHLRKAKLMFFYVRYPSSAILKMYFPDIKFNKNNTAQLVKWFSNFREFYYIQMEKYARQAISEGVKSAEDIHVSMDSELIRVLNLHYNRNNHLDIPEHFRYVVECTLREFYKSIIQGKDAEQSWKKAIYKIIARLDETVPDYFKSPNFLEQLE